MTISVNKGYFKQGFLAKYCYNKWVTALGSCLVVMINDSLEYLQSGIPTRSRPTESQKSSELEGTKEWLPELKPQATNEGTEWKSTWWAFGATGLLPNPPRQGIQLLLHTLLPEFWQFDWYLPVRRLEEPLQKKLKTKSPQDSHICSLPPSMKMHARP